VIYRRRKALDLVTGYVAATLGCAEQNGHDV
jgi:hypothetical protein